MKYTPKRPFRLFALNLATIAAASQLHGAFEADDPFAVVGGQQNQINLWMAYTDVENAFYRHLMDQAVEMLDERAAKVAEIDTVQGVKARQEWLRETFNELVGPFPEKTPLNARVTGVVEKPGYTVEKVIYESVPGFPVTAALFIPEGLKGKAPTVLFCSGHSWTGFRAPVYQRAILNMVNKGFIVFAFDPMGQGERLQYYDPLTDESRIAYDDACSEHSFVGAQCFVGGSSLARFFIWDGVRALDYLETRPEVDMSRIGCTGNSGGGTQTAYLAAFDERIKAAAPSCFITGLKRLFQSIGPQDAEQNWLHDIAAGLDHPDFLIARAPMPILLATTSNDFFSVQGAHETFQEAKRIYELLGAGDALQKVEDVSTHGYTDPNNEAITAFFQKHLDLPGDPTVSDVTPLTMQELQVTSTGQVSTALDALAMFDVQALLAQDLLKSLEKSRRGNLPTHLDSVLESARHLSGYVAPKSSPKAPLYMGKTVYDGYSMTKHVIDGEGDYPIPYLLFMPSGVESPDVVLYLNASGKAAEAAPGGQIEAIVRQGFAVLAPDLLGKGEMGPGNFRGDSYYYRPGNSSFNMQFAALRIGRSLPGIHASDISRLVDVLKNSPRLSSSRITAVATNELAPALVHAAAFDNRIDELALVGGLGSYETIVTNRYYLPELFLQAVAASLTAYDLPDLEATLAPKRLLILDQVDHTGKPGAFTADADQLEILRRAYANKPNQLTVAVSDYVNSSQSLLLQWLQATP